MTNHSVLLINRYRRVLNTLIITISTKQEEEFTMNKTELVAAIAEQALTAFTEVVTRELKKGEKIQLVGFGTFEVVERAAREGRNPQTGKAMHINASKAPKFKPGKALKDEVDK